MNAQNHGGIAFYLQGARQDEQQALCVEYALLYFGLANIEPLVFRDDAPAVGTAGTDETALPDGLARLRKEAREGKLRAVICAELGVLCRNTGELPETARYFTHCGTALVFARERLDTSSATGRALLYTAELLLELERNAAAANIRENMRGLARTGRWMGGVTPTGYIFRSVSGKAGQSKAFKLELHPGQAETVRLIYSMFLESDSLSDVTRALADMKIKTKNLRGFSRFTIRQILENPVYMKADADAFAYFSSLGAEVSSPKESFDGTRGMMVYNKTAQQHGKPPQQRHPSEWIVAVGEHEGLIGGASWVAVQKQLGRNKPGAARKPKSDYGLMAGLICCGNCGAYMRPKLKQRDDGSGEAAFVYLCESKEQTRSGVCSMPNMPGHAADSAAISLLASLGPDEPDILPPRTEQAASPDALAAHIGRMEEKRGLIAQNDENISALVFSLIKTIDKGAYDEIIKQINALHERGDRLRAELSAMRDLSGPHPMEEDFRESLKELLASLAGDDAAMSMSRRRAALRAIIESLTWDGSELLARFAGGAEFAVSF